MFGLDPEIGGSAVRLWVAAGSAALLVSVCALAFDWTRTRVITRVAAVIIGAGLGGMLAWTFLNVAGARDNNAERRALEARAAELNVRVLAPGSPLSCLDGLSGDSVETACEKALFASPANVAMATTYVAARLALLADVTAYRQRGGANIDGVLLPLRRGLETDRFGFVAHMLTVRDGCTSDHCQALSLLRDPSKVRANMSGETLDHFLDRYVVAWAQAPGGVIAETGAAPAPVAAQTAEPPKKSALNVDFPGADSIPAVSIMNPEPKGPVTPASAAAAVAAGQQSSAKVVGPQQMPPMPGSKPVATASRERETPAKGKRGKAAANPPPAQTAAQAPQPAGPPVEPVWSPGATLASPQPAASAPMPLAPPQPAASAPASSSLTSGVPLSGMPVQLAPFTGAPQDSGTH